MNLVERSNTYSIKYDALENYYPSKDLTPMWVADMDFETPFAIRDALASAINYKSLGYNYVPNEFYDAIINWVKDIQGYKIEKDWLTFIPGVVKGIGYVINYFTNKGDGIVVQPPIYPPFINLPKFNYREVFFNNLIFDGKEYKMDFVGLREILRINKIKLLLLSNPHNPAGILWDKDTLIELANICAQYNVIVVSDEIHADMPLWGNKHMPFASVSECAANNSITFGAPSKTFNMAGVVSSYAYIPNVKLREGFYNWLTVNELNSPTIFATLGAIAAFTKCKDWRLDMIKYIEDNIVIVKEFSLLNFKNLIVPVIPSASFLIWLDCRKLQKVLMDNKKQLLADFFVNNVKIALNNGESFGPAGIGFMRMNIGCSKELLIKVLNDIKREIDKLII